MTKDDNEDIVEESDSCPICLNAFNDRTLIPTCAHEFCFACIREWTEQSQKCPLCNQLVADHLIHRIRGRFDYQKYFISPLTRDETGPGPSRRMRRERAHREEADRLEQSIEMRRAVYEWHLYAKHVASNAFTKYRPYPTPAQFSASPELIRRATSFLRREFRVWPNMDVEFLTTFTISIMKAIDIRSEGAIKLLAEFLDLDGGKENAEHFAHEIYTYYDDPPERDHRWIRPISLEAPTSHREESPRRSPHRRSSPRHRGREPSRTYARHRSSSLSWSPSGRSYPSIHQSPSTNDQPRTRNKGKQKARRSASPPSRRSASPPPRRRRSPSLEQPRVPTTLPETRLPPLPPRPPRPPRSALEALHAHLGVGKGKAKEEPAPPPESAEPSPPLTLPLTATSTRQEDLQTRLQALKSEAASVESAVSNAQPDGEAREKQLKLQARLAAEKRNNAPAGPGRSGS